MLQGVINHELLTYTTVSIRNEQIQKVDAFTAQPVRTTEKQIMLSWSKYAPVRIQKMAEL